MKTFAKVSVLGHVGNEPETRHNPSGSAMTTFVVYTNERWKDKNTNQTQERTERCHIVAFGRLAEIARDYVKKGAPVYLEGNLCTRKWQDQNKTDRYITEIVASEIVLLPSTKSLSEPAEDMGDAAAPRVQKGIYDEADFKNN